MTSISEYERTAYSIQKVADALGQVRDLALRNDNFYLLYSRDYIYYRYMRTIMQLHHKVAWEKWLEIDKQYGTMESRMEDKDDYSLDEHVERLDTLEFTWNALDMGRQFKGIVQADEHVPWQRVRSREDIWFKGGDTVIIGVKGAGKSNFAVGEMMNLNPFAYIVVTNILLAERAHNERDFRLNNIPFLNFMQSHKELLMKVVRKNIARRTVIVVIDEMEQAVNKKWAIKKDNIEFHMFREQCRKLDIHTVYIYHDLSKVPGELLADCWANGNVILKGLAYNKEKDEYKPVSDSDPIRKKYYEIWHNGKLIEKCKDVPSYGDYYHHDSTASWKIGLNITNLLQKISGKTYPNMIKAMDELFGKQEAVDHILKKEWHNKEDVDLFAKLTGWNKRKISTQVYDVSTPFMYTELKHKGKIQNKRGMFLDVTI